jgi:hypothetical protein
MKTLWTMLLLAGAMGTGLAWAQEKPEPGLPRPPAPREQMEQMELRNRSLDLVEREEKMRFQHDMNALQLEKCRQDMERPASPSGRFHGHPRCLVFMIMICGVVHLLTTAWVYQDIKRRNSGSGIWIALALLTGLCGTAVYALVRIGDRPNTAAT